MSDVVLRLDEIRASQGGSVGGKAANLGELSRIPGITVPNGFCITTAAYRRVIDQAPGSAGLLEQLSGMPVDDESLGDLTARIRHLIETTPVPDDIAAEIASHLTSLGESAVAVRSSATAEDLPTASFAGQQDTYLNVIGVDAVLNAVRRCWASLFTDRAVAYRIRNGLGHGVELAVVIQTMVTPTASGVMFTADPVSGNRRVVSIDSTFGLGEGLVSGMVRPDNHHVRDGRLIERSIAAKTLTVEASEGGGTQQRSVPVKKQRMPSITDAQVLELARTGRHIERHFGCPQDIEWCLVDGRVVIVQSRPITTFYPVPEPSDGPTDSGMHVYMSIGHQQMMTDAMKPLGLSFFDLQLTPRGNAPQSFLVTAGGRLFMDLAHDLASPLTRRMVVAAMGIGDPLARNALERLLARKGFVASLSRRGPRLLNFTARYYGPGLVVEAVRATVRNDPAIIDRLRARNARDVRALETRTAELRGDAVFAAVLDTLPEMMKTTVEPRSLGQLYAGVFALRWVETQMKKWLGEEGAGDALTQSVSRDITSDMGLDLLDVADVVRRSPAVLGYFENPADDTFVADLDNLEGGPEVRAAIQRWLDAYGMRCPGEIDITRPRFAEQPTLLVPMILSAVRTSEPNSRQALVERGLAKARDKERDLLARLARLPGGGRKARRARKKISVLRNFIGCREYPKYLMVTYYWILKQALMREADALAGAGVVAERGDVDYLTFAEFREAVRTGHADTAAIAVRKSDFQHYLTLSAPRVITSEGEIVSGEYDREGVPAGALVGVAVSPGIVEGRARVVRRVEDAHLEAGDLLVTAYTDPSWTPAFVSIAGLVVEVGGALTHGAVVAREYGLPAVVAVEGATRLIADGRRIRVNGTEGYVQLL